jgi:hypothetical protein
LKNGVFSSVYFFPTDNIAPAIQDDKKTIFTVAIEANIVFPFHEAAPPG